MSKSNSNQPKNFVVLLILLGLMVFVVWGLIQTKQPKPLILQGYIEIQQTPIAAKVPGRIATIDVKEGEQVQIGKQLISMDSPEINAKIEQAKAGRAMAQSQLDKANHGARPQEIAMAKYQWEAYQSAADLAKSTYERINRLAEEGLMARQKRDEAYTNYVASQDKANIAKAQYDMAKIGARDEDKQAAAAQVAQVEAKMQEALIAQEEANLKSPIAGTVEKVIVKAGEVVGQGVPLLTLVDPNQQWMVLNVTEDKLAHFAIGQQFTAKIPALSTKDTIYQQTFEVYASSVLSDFATWRPTNSQDGFDIRTFEIKARAKNPNTQLRQGMTVLVEIPNP